jgi:hypothetical protein
MEKELRHDDCLLCAESVAHKHGDFDERKIRYEHSERFQIERCGGAPGFCDVCIENYYYYHGDPEPRPKMSGVQRALSLEGRDIEKGQGRVSF